jgi:hypothetical protein
LNTLQFIASLVSSLAWPMAVIVIVIIFRSQIRQLASRPLRRLRAGPVEMEFDRLLSEVELAVEALASATSGGPTGPGSPVIEELEGMVPTSPVAAVLEAHAAVERELRDLLAEADPAADTSRMPTSRLLREALERGIITPEAAKAVEGITVMRNLAAHGRASEISPERAREYLALVDAVLFTLHQRPTPDPYRHTP